MSIFYHILIATCYTLVAVAVATALPYGFPAIDLNGAIVLGGVLLIGAALLHEVFTRQESESKLADEIQMLQLEQGDARREMDQSRIRLRNLQRSLEQVVEEHEAIAGQNRDVDSVIAEVKVLQTLIEQFSSSTIGKAAVRPALKPARIAPTVVAGRAAASVPPTKPESDSGAVALPDAHRTPVPLDVSDDEILQLVRDGLEANRVDLVLQPVVNLPQRRLKFYEAFTRIRDGKGGTLMPQQYIAIAEREGLITAIDNMMLFRCVQLVRRSQQRKHNIGFFCNISA
ncbi:MAG: EAL domain-containing protein, partial [Alphaproteobacteria bacterium]